MMSKFKNRILLLSCLFCCVGLVNSQEKELRFRLKGKVIDAKTQKAIKKMPIQVLPFNKVIDADNKGAFLFNMPIGKYILVFNDAPYSKQEIVVDLHSDTTILVQLQCPYSTKMLDEVETVANKPATDKPAGIAQLDARTFIAIPTIVGERDILKALSLTAGVSSSSEGAADIQVRGGMNGQNQFLLDGVPLYTTKHFFGMVSAYNPTIIKSA